MYSFDFYYIFIKSDYFWYW